MKKIIHSKLAGILFTFLAFTLLACSGEKQNEQNESEAVDTTATTQTMTQDTSSYTKLNINTASEEDFLTIPGVGDKIAYEFEEYRPYVSIQQFRKEMGKYVDEETVAGYEEYIFVPIDANESDAATLQQIPGLDADEAQQLVDGRPYDSSDAFIESLSQYVSDDELEIAKTYMKS